ncbi:hydroxyacid dehydrogenase [Pseudomonas sp. GX19020]|uniref:hydroxyacid dehydrogenase n=1 Tax=Pseudomonas sp. GX19020 TaxID=2942277 RepID=UPI00201A1E0C|nr:hydroxyacid dehydrogenase [Pseudomonas sp. GX19020]MCL4068359.1 hydroxyacid dehydrogenase [Pseudomonas sp. GX19020]
MPHLLIAGKLHPSGTALLDVLKTKGFTIDYVEEVSEPSCAALIHKADALVIRTQPLTAATIAKAGRLKVVSRHGVGYDSVDLAALNARGIALTIVGDVNSVSVAEHAMMQLLAGAKRVLLADRAVREPSEWNWRNRLEAHEISDKNLLIIGYGRTGQRLAKMAAGFDMKIRAYDPWLSRSGWPKGQVGEVTDLAEALAWADCISVHVPKAEHPTIGAAEIALMKPGVVLANTARGGVVDEDALTAALISGQVGAAGLDVFAEEPPSRHIPLFDLPNAVLSPHIAGLTAECAARMAVSSIENAVNFLAGSIDPQLIVNRDVANAS